MFKNPKVWEADLKLQRAWEKLASDRENENCLTSYLEARSELCTLIESKADPKNADELPVANKVRDLRIGTLNSMWYVNRILTLIVLWIAAYDAVAMLNFCITFAQAGMSVVPRCNSAPVTALVLFIVSLLWLPLRIVATDYEDGVLTFFREPKIQIPGVVLFASAIAAIVCLFFLFAMAFRYFVAATLRRHPGSVLMRWLLAIPFTAAFGLMAWLAKGFIEGIQNGSKAFRGSVNADFAGAGMLVCIGFATIGAFLFSCLIVEFYWCLTVLREKRGLREKLAAAGVHEIVDLCGCRELPKFTPNQQEAIESLLKSRFWQPQGDVIAEEALRNALDAEPEE